MPIDLGNSSFKQTSDIKSHRVLPEGNGYAQTSTKKEGIKSYTHSPFVPKIILPLLAALGIALKVQTDDGKKTVYLSKASTIHWLKGNTGKTNIKTSEIATLFNDVIAKHNQQGQGPGQNPPPNNQPNNLNVQVPSKQPPASNNLSAEQALNQLESYVKANVAKGSQFAFKYDNKNYQAYFDDKKNALFLKLDKNNWISFKGMNSIHTSDKKSVLSEDWKNCLLEATKQIPSVQPQTIPGNTNIAPPVPQTQASPLEQSVQVIKAHFKLHPDSPINFSYNNTPFQVALEADDQVYLHQTNAVNKWIYLSENNTCTDQANDKGPLANLDPDWQGALITAAQIISKGPQVSATMPGPGSQILPINQQFTVKEKADHFTKPTDDLRKAIRLDTVKKVKELSNAKLPDYTKETVLYVDDEISELDGSVLNRGNILAVRGIMAYDGEWKPLDPNNQKPFYIHHAAAPNIGENAKGKSDDYERFCTNGKLDQTKYLAEMGKITNNILKAQTQSGVTDSVWFPFGMGAFLRNLGTMEPEFGQRSTNFTQKMCNLRHDIAESMVNEWLKFPELTVHLCLPHVDEESNQNYNAFALALEEAIQKHPGLKDRVMIYENKDATDVAQKLSNSGKNAGLVNGANRHLIGNHYFAGRADTAIDENIHRRSPAFAFLASLVNGLLPGSVATKAKDLHQNAVRGIGGKVISLKNGQEIKATGQPEKPILITPEQVEALQNKLKNKGNLKLDPYTIFYDKSRNCIFIKNKNITIKDEINFKLEDGSISVRENGAPVGAIDPKWGKLFMEALK